MLGTGAYIASPWRLRNDGTYIVAYECVAESIKYRVLTPYEAIIAPFLDGTVSKHDLWAIWLKVVGVEETRTNSTRQTFDELLGRLHRSGIVAEEGLLSPSLSEQRSRFIPDFCNYKIPGHRLARPMSVMVGITDTCRTNCIYCYAERKNRKRDELSVEEWIDIFDELRDNEIYIVDISGGDLLSHKNAIRLLTEMADREFVFFLSTKCPIDPSTASRLAELGIGRADAPAHLRRTIQISIDSNDPIIADRLVRRRGYLDRARRSVENCVAAGFTPRVKGVLTSLNPEAAEGVVRLFEPLGVRDFQFSQYGRTYYRHDESLFLSKEQKLRLRDQHARILARYPHIRCRIQDDQSVGRNDNRDWQSWNSRSVCSAGRLSMIIKANGDATLCDQIPQNEEFVVGNVKESGVMGVWQSPSVNRFLEAPRESFKLTACFECRDFDRCHTSPGTGYCFRDSLFAYGTVYEPPPNCPRQPQAGLRRV